MSTAGRLASTTLSLLVLCSAVPAFGGGSAIKKPESLNKALAKVEKKLLKKHLSLAKKMKKKHEWESWLEACAAARIDPEAKGLAKLLPVVAPLPPVSGEKDAKYKAARKEIQEYAIEELGELVERAKKGGLAGKSVEALGVRLLGYDQNHAGAREALGFTGKENAWVSKREAKIQAAFDRAKKKAPEGKKLDASPLPALESALGMELSWRESEHALVAWIKGSDNPERVTTIIKSAETAYAALAHDLFGRTTFYSPPNARPTTAEAKLPPWSKLVYLVLDNKKQHDIYCDEIPNDPNLKVQGKSLGFVLAFWKKERKWVVDTYQEDMFLEEWPAIQMVLQFFRVNAPNRPTYLSQGIARYYAAHVSGDAKIVTVPVGSESAKGATKDEKELMKPGPYLRLRSLAREAYNRFSAPMPAAGGLNKTLDAMDRRDNALATAWIDWLIAEEHTKLESFLRRANSKERQTREAFESVWGRATPEEVDKKFAAWLERNY